MAMSKVIRNPQLSFKDLIQTILSKYVNLSRRESEMYGKHFEELSSKIFKELRKCPQLNSLIVELSLEGSSGDLLKIAKPNEFDLVFKLLIPYYESIVVTRDSTMPGNVLLDMTRVLRYLKDDPRPDRQSIRKLLLSLVSNNYLAVDLLQSWLQSRFSRAIDQIAKRVEMDGIKLRYKTCGPAHTIVVEGQDLEYSVDYVPAIRLGAEQNVLGAEQLTYFRLANLSHWDAIPKPLKMTTVQISFRSSFYEAERVMLRGENMINCLDGIKLIKKFRDVKTNLSNLKSYYIKTLFLWKIRQELPDYWLRPLTVILTDMFDELTECLRQGRLSFYWDPELNMLDLLTRDQLTEMYRCVQKFSDMLRRQVGSVPSRRTGVSPLVVLRAFSHKEERTPLRAFQLIAKRKDIKTTAPLGKRTGGNFSVSVFLLKSSRKSKLRTIKGYSSDWKKHRRQALGGIWD